MKNNPSSDKVSANKLNSKADEYTSTSKKSNHKTTSLEESLNKIDRKGRTWLENSPVCTKIIDTDFNLQYMSIAGITALQIDDVNKYYGKPYPFNFFPEASKKEIIAEMEKVVLTGKTLVAEAPICDIYGNGVWYQAIISRVDNDNGSMDYLMVVSSEITQRREAEEKLQIKNAELLKQNEKYETLNAQLKKSNVELELAKQKAIESEKLKSSFLANLSHEIRTPLNAILGFSRLLKEDEGIDNNEKVSYLEHVEKGGQRLLRIITDIVDISKLDVHQLSIHNKECDINALIDNLHGQFSLQLNNKSISLISTKGLSDNKSKVATDATRLAQVLGNLIENAGKFTTNGHIEFGYQKEGEMLKFHVKDTGIGISEKDTAAIFERFRQIENEISGIDSGTGLGLSISKELVKLMKGDIWVESVLGAGSTFYFSIPYNTADSPIKETPVQNSFKKDKERTILIAEDEKVNLLYLKAILRNSGLKILHAENGKEAVEMVKNNDAIELILMDMRMPVMGGMEAAIEIRKDFKKLPIVAQTAYAMAEDEQKALDIGFNEYLSKPLRKKDVLGIIEKYLQPV